MGRWNPVAEPDELEVAHVEDDIHRLELDRERNDQRFKRHLERIFDKYGHDFTGIGDEIDVVTGEVVVNNGHLQNIRDEGDFGVHHCSQLLKSFEQDLEAENSEDERDESVDRPEGPVRASHVVEESSQEENAEDLTGITSDLSDKSDSTRETTLQTFNILARPAPRLAHLLVDQEKKLRKAGDLANNARTPQHSAAHEFEHNESAKHSDRVPDLQDTFNAFKSQSVRGSLDADTIQALGMSIATGLAQMMSGSPSKKRKRSLERPTIREEAWWYPEPGAEADISEKPRGLHARRTPYVQDTIPNNKTQWTAESKVSRYKRRSNNRIERPLRRGVRQIRSELRTSRDSVGASGSSRMFQMSRSEPPIVEHAQLVPVASSAIKDSMPVNAHCVAGHKSAVETEADTSSVVSRPRYTQAEEELLIRLRGEGLCWTDIARQFPTRTKNSLANYWSAKLRRKLAFYKSRPDAVQEAVRPNHIPRAEEKVTLENCPARAAQDDQSRDTSAVEVSCKEHLQVKENLSTSVSDADNAPDTISNACRDEASERLIKLQRTDEQGKDGLKGANVEDPERHVKKNVSQSRPRCSAANILRRSIAVGEGTKRIVETPLKDFDDSEDELG